MMSDAPNRTMKMFGSPVIDNLSLKPSEYVRRNVYYGLSGPVALKALFDQRDVTGVDHLLWGSDYPHPEGTWPQTASILEQVFKGFPEADVRAILGGNAVSWYGLDEPALNQIAARIGPQASLFS